MKRALRSAIIAFSFLILTLTIIVISNVPKIIAWRGSKLWIVIFVAGVSIALISSAVGLLVSIIWYLRKIKNDLQSLTTPK